MDTVSNRRWWRQETIPYQKMTRVPLFLVNGNSNNATQHNGKTNTTSNDFKPASQEQKQKSSVQEGKQTISLCSTGGSFIDVHTMYSWHSTICERMGPRDVVLGTTRTKCSSFRVFDDGVDFDAVLLFVATGRCRIYNLDCTQLVPRECSKVRAW